jgi:hypothetical protein
MRCELAIARLRLVSLLGIALALLAAHASAQSAGDEASVLEIPIAIDLTPLARAADARLPWEAGHWRGWREERGIETRYRAWRGPLAVQAEGDVVRVQAHVRYWLRARKRLIGGFGLDTGCGVDDEPPRQAIVGLEMRVAWGPDWTLRPSFRVLPVRFIDRCEVTALNINVSPLIGRVFRERMEDALRDALRELRPRLAAAQRQAAEQWQALQGPMELTPGVWLQANPLAVALAPARGTGQRLESVLGLILAPRIQVGEPGIQPERPLPPLQVFYPRQGGMTFDLALDLELGALGRHLSERLQGTTMAVEGREVRLERVELAGEGESLKVTADLGGEVAGRIEIWAKPVFDPGSQRLGLRDLEFVYGPEDPNQGLMVNLFYQRIQRAIEEGANELLASRSDAVRDGLARNLERVLPQGLDVDLSGVSIRKLDIAVADSSLRLRGTGVGSVAVTSR